jgi:Zn ribbon nucleic-acid-binding protein
MSRKEYQLECPHCHTFNCYKTIDDEKENYEFFLCFTCGYTSNSTFTIESDKEHQVEKAEGKTAQIIKELAFKDEDRGLMWYPTVLHVAGIGMIFPEPTEDGDWQWNYSPIEIILEKDQEKFPIEGQSGQFYKTRIAMEKGQRFNKNNFMDACKSMGIIEDNS